MLGSFLITLREGLEAALIIGIILAYLGKLGNRKAFRAVWLGTAVAVLVSLIAGVAIDILVGELQDPGEAIFEGSVLLVAVAVLTWMRFWMRKEASSIKTSLQKDVQSALTGGSMLGLATIAFVAVVREGIETVLFLFAATRIPESPLLFTMGGILGLAIAVAIGYTIYKGSSRLNLRTFFNYTGLLLIIFAAGLLSQGVHEFNVLGIIPPVIQPLWDSSRIVSPDSTFGQFLGSLFGYEAEPSLTQVIAYWAFMIIAFGAFIRSMVTNGPKKAVQETAKVPAKA